MPVLTFLFLNSACCLGCCDVICPSLDCSPWISLSTFSPGLWSCTEDPGSRNSDWCFKAVSFHFFPPTITVFSAVLLYCWFVAFPVLIPKKWYDQVYILWNRVLLAFLLIIHLFRLYVAGVFIISRFIVAKYVSTYNSKVLL